MPFFFASGLALLLGALSLGPSFAHVLEAYPRLTIWPPNSGVKQPCSTASL